MSLVSLRKFSEADIEKKVEWINDSENNAFLHYNLPLNFEDTRKWFLQNKNNKSRCDMTILYDNIPVGVIGIINIKDKKGEYYITLGDNNYRRKGISFDATKLILEIAFTKLNLEKVWLCVDEENIPAVKLYEKAGFKLEGTLRKDIYFKGKMINRLMYGLLKEEWEQL